MLRSSIINLTHSGWTPAFVGYLFMYTLFLHNLALFSSSSCLVLWLGVVWIFHLTFAWSVCSFIKIIKVEYVNIKSSNITDSGISGISSVVYG